MKVIWRGSINFGLVNIPIMLYGATQPNILGFTLLHEVCKTPLHYRRWCTKCDKEVEWQEAVKGIKVAKNTYIVVTKETLKSLRPEKTETLRIIEFVDADQIEALYFDHHYYVAPKKEDDVAYALFMKALQKTNKVAIGKFVMRDKEHICVLHAYETYFLLTTLHYAYEIKKVKEIALNKVKIEQKELKLAQEFVERLSVTSFDITKFKDTFAQQLKTFITKKSKGKKIAVPKTKTVGTKKPSLYESLAASLQAVDHQPGVSRR